jgi:hypothetical protein
VSKRIQCPHCENDVTPRKLFGLSDIFMVFITAGLWIITIPFADERCPKCKKVIKKKSSE